MPALPLLHASLTLGAILSMLAGVLFLRRRWQRRSDARPQHLAVGWLLIAAGGMAMVLSWRPELGLAHGLLAFSLMGYLVVFAGADYRSARLRAVRETSLAPQARRTNWARGTAKAFLAIVLSGVAAIGLGIAFALAMPLEIHDRVVLGGLLVPVLWGGGMAWTLCDARLLRATGVLLAVSAISYGVAFLPGLFS
ncbi:hypothetical protein [Xanthobacter sediminis]|uniref:hypothetical protein n=1 Tax=Xanthobacter sediminis TaxID=3119926 RepID=UPI00372B5357